MVISISSLLFILQLLVPVGLASDVVNTANDFNNCIIDKESKKRKEITAYALRFVGSRYRSAGKTPKGFDCSGFAQFVYKHFDIQIEGSSKNMLNTGKKKKVKQAQAGDLLFFARGGRVFHVAIVISNDKSGIKVVHATSSRGVRIDNVTHSNYWKSKLYTVREVIKV